jgi:hypothetical protein
MPLTNPPFTRDPKRPPLHLREWTAEELDQHRRMVEKQEQACGASRRRDTVPTPSPKA